MLRLGHLSVLCAVARESGNGWPRIDRGFVERISSRVPIDPRDPHLVTYLASRRLCIDRRRDDICGEVERGRLRYPDLEILEGPNGEAVVASRNGAPLAVWSQDLLLSRPGVPSRVGAVTVSGKSGSKTGVSHILDWGETIGMFSSGGQLLPVGDLLGAIAERSQNPYQLGSERLVLGALWFGGDIDFSSRFLVRLHAVNGIIDKSTARNAFVEAVREAAKDAEEQKGTRARDRFLVFEQLKELERSTRESGKGEAKASTAWHRTVSRLEAYVDLGMLGKASASDAGAFEYRYRPTAALEAVCDAVQSSKSIRELLRQHLTALLCPELQTNSLPSQEELLRGLATVTLSMRRPIASYPMDAIVLGIAIWLAEQRSLVSLGEIEDAIVNLAKHRSDVIRLGSGAEGMLPETVSINRMSLRGLVE